jgi:hypothetical protein
MFEEANESVQANPDSTKESTFSASMRKFTITINTNAKQRVWDQRREVDREFLEAIFTTYREDGKKDGPCFVPGTFVGNERKTNAVDKIDFLVYDVDGRQTYEELEAIMEAAGVYGFIYTSFNHLTTKTEIAVDHYIRWAKKNDLPEREASEDDVIAYVADKANRKDHLTNAKCDMKIKQTENGQVFVITHDPLPKMRVVIPLNKTIVTAELAIGSKGATAEYKSIYHGVGGALGIDFDTACEDPSRLYYFPSCKPGAETITRCFLQEMEEPPLLDWEAYPRAAVADKATKASLNGSNAAEKAETQNHEAPTNFARIVDKTGKTLNLYRTAIEGFDIEALLAKCLPDEMKKGARASGSGFHIECPFESEHSTTGGSGTFCTNDNGHGKWTINCCHDSCKSQERDRMDHLSGLVHAGYVTADDIEELLPDPRDAIKESLKSLEPLFTDDCNAPELDPTLFAEKKRAVYRAIADAKLSDDEESAWLDKLCGIIGYARTKCATDTHRAYKKFKKEHRNKAQKLKAQQNGSGASREAEKELKQYLNYHRIPFARVASNLVSYMRDTNAKNPEIFNAGIGLTRVQHDPIKRCKISVECGYAEMQNYLNQISDFAKTGPSDDPGEDGEMNFEAKHTPVPKCFTEHIMGAPISELGLPPLQGVVMAPFYDKDFQLVATPGYDVASGYYYAAPDDADPIPTVSPEPSQKEVDDAVALLFEAFHDFPFNDGEDLPREWHETSDPTVKYKYGKASRANQAAKLLQFPLRVAIDGNKPFHAVDKTKARTGSQYMADVINIIWTGRRAINTQFPTNDDEWQKVVIAQLLNKTPFFMLDNVQQIVRGPLLASMATGAISGRLLGKSQMVEGAWTAVTEINGNNLVFDPEIAERSLLVRLDACMKDPQARKSFKHDVHDWTMENRSRIIAACLTLIENWKAKGRPMLDDEKRILGGFEDYCRVIGGILEAAGIEGFNTNRKFFRKDERECDVEAFMQEVFEVFGTTRVLPGVLDDDAKPNHSRRARGNATSLAVLALDMSGEIDMGLFGTNARTKSLGARLVKNVLAKHQGTIFEFDGQTYRFEKLGREYHLKPVNGASERQRWDVNRLRDGFDLDEYGPGGDF